MPNSPHDALFRYTFGQPEHAGSLLRTVLPPAARAGLDWSTLQLLPGTRLDRRLQRHQTDLLFSVHSKGARREVLLLLLVEHSSRVVWHMAFRMLDYAVGIWRDLLRGDPGRRRLPRIVPVVIHHGWQGWTAALDFADLLDEVAVGSGEARQPRFRYDVLSTSAMSSEELDGLALTLLGKLTLVLLQEGPRASPGRFARALARWGYAMLAALGRAFRRGGDGGTIGVRHPGDADPARTPDSTDRERSEPTSE